MCVFLIKSAALEFYAIYDVIYVCCVVLLLLERPNQRERAWKISNKRVCVVLYNCIGDARVCVRGVLVRVGHKRKELLRSFFLSFLFLLLRNLVEKKISALFVNSNLLLAKTIRCHYTRKEGN